MRLPLPSGQRWIINSLDLRSQQGACGALAVLTAAARLSTTEADDGTEIPVTDRGAYGMFIKRLRLITIAHQKKQNLIQESERLRQEIRRQAQIIKFKNFVKMRRELKANHLYLTFKGYSDSELSEIGNNLFKTTSPILAEQTGQFLLSLMKDYEESGHSLSLELSHIPPKGKKKKEINAPEYKKICDQFNEKVQRDLESWKEKTLLESEKIILDMDIFKENVDMLQAKLDSTHLLGEKKWHEYGRLTSDFPLIMPVALEEAGGMEKITDFYSIYSVKELRELYFEDLEKHFKNNKVSEPVVLFLDGNHHRIAAIYEPKYGKWRLIDANKFQDATDDTYLYTGAEIAKAIINPMTGCRHYHDHHPYADQSKAAIETMVYAGKKDLEKIKKAMHDWQSSDGYKRMHKITREKAIAVDENSSSWFYLADRRKDLKTSMLLWMAGADTSIKPTGSLFSCIYEALYKGETTFFKKDALNWRNSSMEYIQEQVKKYPKSRTAVAWKIWEKIQKGTTYNEVFREIYSHSRNKSGLFSWSRNTHMSISHDGNRTASIINVLKRSTLSGFHSRPDARFMIR